MVELRWVMHDLKDGQPPYGSICVGERLYQKLQYRNGKDPFYCNDGTVIVNWEEWKDVKHDA